MLKVINSVIVVLTTLFVSIGCSSTQESYISIEATMIGTSLHLTAKLPQDSVEALEARIDELDARMKSEMSIFDPESVISRINRGEIDQVTPWIEANIRLADSISRLSNGYYDITVAPLVEAWGFGGSYNAMLEGEHPEPNIDSLLEFVGYRGVLIENGRIIKQDPRVQIDLNSIAKGFTVDRLADIVESFGCRDYMVDIGGELRLSGVSPRGEGWRVGVESPIDGNMTSGGYLEQRIQIADTSDLCAIATSGNYRRFYRTKSGEKIVHTIDPHTGRAKSSSLLSATVLARSCAEADGYATMLMAAGDFEARDLAQSIDGCEVYLIFIGGDGIEDEYIEYFSEGMRARLMD